jgi:hypothetical protein
LTAEAEAPPAGVARERGRRLRPVLVFSVGYCLGAVLSFTVGCLLAGWRLDDRLWDFLALVAGGSLLAALFSWVAASLVAGRRPPSGRFAAMLVALTVSTAGFTALLFFLDHFFAEGRQHAPFLSKAFLIEVFYSGLSVTYLFAVTGLRLFFPLGLVALFFASHAFAVRREL